MITIFLDSIREGIENGLKTKLVFVKFNAESPMKTVGGVQVYVELKDSGDIIASVPSLQIWKETNFIKM